MKEDYKLLFDQDDTSKIVQQILDLNESIHIDGRAGTGKTTLIRKLQDEMTRQGKSYISNATTNKAARLLKDGKTIHMFALQCTMKFIRECKANYIFIDEISMMEEKFYKFIITLKKTDQT